MSSLFTSGLARPGYALGFARSRGESAYPNLWNGLVAAYDPCLGPTGGTLFDHAGQSLSGTLTSMDPATDWVTGERGWALDFDGTNDRVAVNALGVLAGAQSYGTIVTRCYPRASGTLNGIVCFGRSSSNNDAIELTVTATPDISFTYRAGGVNVTQTISLTLNKWSHLAGYWSPAVVGAALDGVIVGEQAQGSLIASAFNQGSIGAEARGGTITTFFNGLIAEVFVWTRVLTPGEIRQLYLGASPLTPRRRVLGFVAGSTGAMEGTAAWTWSNTGTLGGTSAAVGTAAWTWTVTGAVTGTAGAVGTTAWTWSTSGAMTGAGAMGGTSAWVWTLTGILGSPGMLAGTSAWVWTTSGTGGLSVQASGTAAWTWTLGLRNSAYGETEWTWSTSGRLHGCRRYSGCQGSDYTYESS